jgi:hypothetical protein
MRDTNWNRCLSCELGTAFAGLLMALRAVAGSLACSVCRVCSVHLDLRHRPQATCRSLSSQGLVHEALGLAAWARIERGRIKAHWCRRRLPSNHQVGISRSHQVHLSTSHSTPTSSSPHIASCPSTERRPSSVAVCIAPNAPVLNLERLLCSLSSLLCPACRGSSPQRWDLLHPNVTTCLLRLPSREHLLASSAYLGSSFCRSTHGEVAPPNHILHRFLPVAPDCLVSRLCTTSHLKWLSTSDNAHNPTCTAIGQQSSPPTFTALTSI